MKKRFASLFAARRRARPDGGPAAGFRAGGRRRPADRVPDQEAAADELVVRRLLRQVRPGAAAARLPGLQGSLLGLPLDESASPSAISARRAVRISARPRSRRWPPPTPSPTGRTTPATCSSVPASPTTTCRRRSPTPRRPRRPMAAPRRPTSRSSPRRAGSSAGCRGGCSISSPAIRRPGRTTSTPC